jgi:high-affinity iron transporter
MLFGAPLLWRRAQLRRRARGEIVLETFVIGLREGLEGALIVGIVAAFLRQQGRTDALRLMWAGVAIAIAICLAAAVALQVWSASLPEAQQDGLETVVGAAAVVMVTYMIVWMRRHARGMKRDLEDAASTALTAGTAWALIGMAILAVLREGFETAVFLLAAFNASGSALAAGIGALLGIGVAAAIGYGIYRGGRLNLARFFRLTGLVLVLVAAGLVATSFHTAHEAGWISAGQVQVVDLGWLIQPGSTVAALLTGVLGLQARPVQIEAAGWLLYLVPMALFVAWPQTRRSLAGPVPDGTPITVDATNR